jgi:DNA-binding transcriptional MerR regulator
MIRPSARRLAASDDMEKSPEAFRTISEVADAIDLPQHVLRFWETRFPQIRPLKRAGGRRYYRPDDVERLRLIKRLLYDEGYTIKGVQKLFKEQGVQALTSGAFEPRFGGAEPPVADARPAEETVVRDAPPDAPYPSIPDVAPPTEEPRVGAHARSDLAALKAALSEIAEAVRILNQARSGET